MWVLGKLNNDGIQSRFAKYAIDKGASGTAYYTGLSLQHTHTQYASGKSKKTPVEVSLCVNPRRADCRIAFVDSMLNHDESEKVTYKILHHASNKMATEAPPEQPQESKPETPAPAETPQEQSEEAGDYGLVNAKLGVQFDNINIELYGRNLTNEDSITWLGTVLPDSRVNRLRPRTLGINLAYQF